MQMTLYDPTGDDTNGLGTTAYKVDQVQAQINFAGQVPGTETDGSLITTNAVWVGFPNAGQCAAKLLTKSTATSGDFACFRARGRADAAGNAEGVNASASAGANNYGNLCGVYAAGQPMAFTQAGAANIVCGMHSVLDDTAAGTSAGRRWSAWVDDHSINKAAAGHFLQRLSSNGTVAIDGVFTIYQGGRTPALINFEDVSGSLSAQSGGSLTITHKIACTIAGVGTVYIPVGTI
jgi:hypothetical protein